MTASLPGTSLSLLGILIGLGLLVWLAYRGWSVLLLAPTSALVAAFFSWEPLLAHWTQTVRDQRLWHRIEGVI